MKASFWVWLAGFFDGEGSISFERKKTKNKNIRYPRIQLVNTDLKTIVFIKENLLQFGIKSGKITKKHPKISTFKEEKYFLNSKVIFQLSISKVYHCLNFLNNVLPFSITKKEKIIQTIKFIKKTNYPYLSIKNSLFNELIRNHLTAYGLSKKLNISHSVIQKHLGEMKKNGIVKIKKPINSCSAIWELTNKKNN